MNEQQTPDREKMIAEIREALRRVELGTYHITAFANLEYWLRFLLSELDLAEKELELFDQRGETIERQLNIIEQLQEENRKLREERDKLIEGLRWYADEDTHEIKRRVLGDFAPITLDKGQRARNILKEIGVTVEPDRLHDARAKIAKARFSPERLVGESAVYGNDCPGGRCEF